MEYLQHARCWACHVMNEFYPQVIPCGSGYWLAIRNSFFFFFQTLREAKKPA